MKAVTLEAIVTGPGSGEKGKFYEVTITYHNMQPKHMAELQSKYIDKVNAAVEGAPVLPDGTISRGTMTAVQVASLEALLALARSDQGNPTEGGYRIDLKVRGADIPEVHVHTGTQKRK